ncbi:hypothetical protein [Halorubellus litoreus]|uniref:HEAT repeat n=1 Tax=Halorubellus litoreus TaxID=755308 RepID=A0ABD5VKT5_9EURY
MTANARNEDRVADVRERLAALPAVGTTPSATLQTRRAVSDARSVVEDEPTAAGRLVPSLAGVLIDTAAFSRSTGTDVFGVGSAVRQVQLDATRALAALDFPRFLDTPADADAVRALVRAFAVSVNVEGTVSRHRVDHVGIRGLADLAVAAPTETATAVSPDVLARTLECWARIDPDEHTSTGSAVVRLLAIVARKAPEKLPPLDDLSPLLSAAAESKYPQLYAWALLTRCTGVDARPSDAPVPEGTDEVVALLAERASTSPDPRIREGAVGVLSDLESLNDVSAETLRGVATSLLEGSGGRDDGDQWVAATGLESLLAAGILPPTVVDTILETPSFGFANSTKRDRRAVQECYTTLLESEQLTVAHLSAILEDLDAFETEEPEKDAFYVARLLVDVVSNEALAPGHGSRVVDLLAEAVTAHDTRAPVKVAVAAEGLLSAVDLSIPRIRDVLDILTEVAASTEYSDVTAEAFETFAKTTPPATIAECTDSVVDLVEALIVNEDGLNGFAMRFLDAAIEALIDAGMPTDALFEAVLRSLERAIDDGDAYVPDGVATCLTVLHGDARCSQVRIRAVVAALERAAVETRGASRVRAFETLSALLDDAADVPVDTRRLRSPLAWSVRSPNPEHRATAFRTLAACARAGGMSEASVREFVPVLVYGSRATHLDVRTAAVEAIEALASGSLLPREAGPTAFWELLGVLLLESPPEARMGVEKFVRGRSDGAAPAAATALHALVTAGYAANQDELAGCESTPGALDRFHDPDAIRPSLDWHTAASTRVIDEWERDTYETVFDALGGLAGTTADPVEAWRESLIERARLPSNRRRRVDVVDRLATTQTLAATSTRDGERHER